MGFIKDAAKGGLFGLAGRAFVGGKDKKREPTGSLTTQGSTTPVMRASLLNQKEIY